MRFIYNGSQLFNLSSIQYIYIAGNHSICGVYNGETLVMADFDTAESAKLAMQLLATWIQTPDEKAKGVFRLR